MAVAAFKGEGGIFIKKIMDTSTGVFDKVKLGGLFTGMLGDIDHT